MTTETLLRNLHNIDEIEHLESSRESTYIFTRDNCEQVNFAHQHFADVNQIHLAVIAPSRDDIRIRSQIELSVNEAKLLRDWLNKEFPL